MNINSADWRRSKVSIAEDGRSRSVEGDPSILASGIVTRFCLLCCVHLGSSDRWTQGLEHRSNIRRDHCASLWGGGRSQGSAAPSAGIGQRAWSQAHAEWTRVDLSLSCRTNNGVRSAPLFSPKLIHRKPAFKLQQTMHRTMGHPLSSRCAILSDPRGQ